MKNTIIKKVVFATSATALITGVGTGAIVGTNPGAFNLVSSVSAAETGNDVSNLSTNWKVSQESPTPTDDPATILLNENIVLDGHFDLKPGAKEGDYVTISSLNPNGDSTKILSFKEFEPIEVKDDNGDLIGTLQYVNENELHLVFTDYVETHVKVKVNFEFIEKFTQRAFNSNNIATGVTVDGKFIPTGNNVIFYDDFFKTSRIEAYQNDTTTTRRVSAKVITQLPRNYSGNAHLVIHSSPAADWDCANVDSKNFVTNLIENSGYGPGIGTLSPDNINIVSCDDTTIIMDLNIPKANSSTQPRALNVFLDSLLTPTVIHNQVTDYYYHGTMTFDNGQEIELGNPTIYKWLTADGSGEIPPQANPDTPKIAFNTVRTIDVLSNDKPGDAEIDPGKMFLVDDKGNDVKDITTDAGTFSVVDGKITFTPNSKFYGEAPKVSYKIFDKNGNYSVSTITATVAEPLAPTATDDNADVAYNTPKDIDVLHNDVINEKDTTWSKVELKQPDGSFSNVLDTEYGTFTVKDDNTIAFAPKAGTTGEVPDVTYKATDSNDQSVTGTLKVTVGENPNPASVQAEDDTSVKTKQNTPVTIDVLANDTIVNDTIKKDSLTLIDKDGNKTDTVVVTGGTYTVANDKVLFTPDKDYSGTVESITYGAITETGLEVSAKVGVTVEKDATPIKDYIANPDDDAKTKQNTPVTIDVLGNDEAGDSPIDPTTLTVKGDDDSKGTFTVVDGKVVFTPAKDFVGEATGTYTIKDANGKEYTSTIKVTVEKSGDTTPPTDTITPPSDNSKDDVTSNNGKDDSKNNNSNNNGTATSNGDNNVKDDSPVEGPKVVTDLVSNTSGMNAASIAGIATMSILGGAAAIRRNRNK